jgi:hypothetical protein
MSLKIKRIIYLILISFVIIFFFHHSVSAQENKLSLFNFGQKKYSLRQDSVFEHKYSAVEPDTNFAWEKYADFLKKVSDTSRYIVLPLNEFRQTFNSKKVVIGLRHDIDNDLNTAFEFSKIESDLGFRSTYFVLHTAPYYLANQNNMAAHSDKIIPILKKMQNERHFEIGWHNDLVTLQVIYNINPVNFFHNELEWLRSNGIKIYGTAAHGSSYCKSYHYMNFYFFHECTFPVVPDRENNITVPKDGKYITLLKRNLSDFNLEYEAYFLNNNKAYSDAVITNGVRWNIGMLDPDKLVKGDRVIILIHPIHWHKPSVHNNIEEFSIAGQKSCLIDSINSKIQVEMPYGTNKSSLSAVYQLSAGAYAKIDGKMQISSKTLNNFNKPITYTVFAENREIKKQWTVEVHTEKNLANFISFSIPGMQGQSKIDTINNTISTEVYTTPKDSVRPSFVLSRDSHAWIGKQEQISDINYRNFSHPVTYDIVSKDSQIIKKWKVNVLYNKNKTAIEASEQPDLMIYPNPSVGNVALHFTGIRVSPLIVDIFNSIGKKVFSEIIKKTGDFTSEINLKTLSDGVYIIKYTGGANPEKIVIKKH